MENHRTTAQIAASDYAVHTSADVSDYQGNRKKARIQCCRLIGLIESDLISLLRPHRTRPARRGERSADSRPWHVASNKLVKKSAPWSPSQVTKYCSVVTNSGEISDNATLRGSASIPLLPRSPKSSTYVRYVTSVGTQLAPPALPR